MESSFLEVIDEASRWLDLDGVEGVGQGKKNGKDCVIVFASSPPSKLSGIIPRVFMGFPVVIEASGSISALEHQSSAESLSGESGGF